MTAAATRSEAVCSQIRPQATNVLALGSKVLRPAAALVGAGHDEAFTRRQVVHGLINEDWTAA
jgi:hypothetical protein